MIDALDIENITFNPHPSYNRVSESCLLLPGIYSDLIIKKTQEKPLITFKKNKDKSIEF